MEVLDAELAVGGLIFASLLALFAFFIARQFGYFQLPNENKKIPVTLAQTIGIFSIYLLLAYLVIPLLNLGLLRLFGLKKMTTEWLGWAQIGSLFVLLICLLIYIFSIKPQTRLYIFQGRSAHSIFMGCLTWVVSYPFVYVVGMLTSLIALWIWKEAKVEQVAVKQLEMMMGNRPLFTVMVFMVVVVVPFMEELLFRGFLQSLLKQYVGRLWGVVLAALVFALVHFAPSQGVGNFQLIASLFTLSLFLGFIYEREESLWASIALHATFNGFSVLLMVL